MPIQRVTVTIDKRAVPMQRVTVTIDKHAAPIQRVTVTTDKRAAPRLLVVVITSVSTSTEGLLTVPERFTITTKDFFVVTKGLFAVAKGFVTTPRRLMIVRQGLIASKTPHAQRHRGRDHRAEARSPRVEVVYRVEEGVEHFGERLRRREAHVWGRGEAGLEATAGRRASPTAGLQGRPGLGSTRTRSQAGKA